MAITAAAVKELRERTGAGMMDCKKALTEADGDLKEAIEILRTKGLAAASKKAHRKASEGAVVVVGDAARMVVLELNCETDFVARSPKFQEFAAALAKQALDSGATTADELKAQAFHVDAEHTVEQAISQQIATIGENIVLSRLARVTARPGHKLSSYIHGGGKIGVVVEGTEAVTAEGLHDVAQVRRPQRGDRRRPGHRAADRASAGHRPGKAGAHRREDGHRQDGEVLRARGAAGAALR
jgi:elongation factor Ts